MIDNNNQYEFNINILSIFYIIFIVFVFVIESVESFKCECKLEFSDVIYYTCSC